MGSTVGETFRFLLLGKTGGGKSSTGNTLLGGKLFDADVSFMSVTSDCQMKMGYNLGAKIEIMDSPGLFDTDKGEEEVSRLVMQAVACMHPGPDAIFYVIKLGRYTEEEFGVYNRLKALLDEGVTKYIIIVFTHGDLLEGNNIRDLLQRVPPSLNQVLQECGYRYHVMDNTGRTQNKETQVQQLLQVVRNLKAANRQQPYKCPKYAFVGDKMEEELSRRLQKVEEKELENKKYVQELNQQLTEAEQEALKEKQQFELREKEREQEIRRKEAEAQKQLSNLTEALKRQEISQEEQKKEVRRLQEKMEAEQKEFRQEIERQRERQMEEVRRKDEQREMMMLKLEEERAAAAKAAMERQAREMELLRMQIAAQNQSRDDGCTIL